MIFLVYAYPPVNAPLQIWLVGSAACDVIIAVTMAYLARITIADSLVVNSDWTSASQACEVSTNAGNHHEAGTPHRRNGYTHWCVHINVLNES